MFRSVWQMPTERGRIRTPSEFPTATVVGIGTSTGRMPSGVWRTALTPTGLAF